MNERLSILQKNSNGEYDIVYSSTADINNNEYMQTVKEITGAINLAFLRPYNFYGRTIGEGDLFLFGENKISGYKIDDKKRIVPIDIENLLQSIEKHKMGKDIRQELRDEDQERKESIMKEYSRAFEKAAKRKIMIENQNELSELYKQGSEIVSYNEKRSLYYFNEKGMAQKSEELLNIINNLQDNSKTQSNSLRLTTKFSLMEDDFVKLKKGTLVRIYQNHDVDRNFINGAEVLSGIDLMTGEIIEFSFYDMSEHIRGDKISNMRPIQNIYEMSKEQGIDGYNTEINRIVNQMIGDGFTNTMLEACQLAYLLDRNNKVETALWINSGNIDVVYNDINKKNQRLTNSLRNTRDFLTYDLEDTLNISDAVKKEAQYLNDDTIMKLINQNRIAITKGKDGFIYLDKINIWGDIERYKDEFEKEIYFNDISDARHYIDINDMLEVKMATLNTVSNVIKNNISEARQYYDLYINYVTIRKIVADIAGLEGMLPPAEFYNKEFINGVAKNVKLLENIKGLNSVREIYYLAITAYNKGLTLSKEEMRNMDREHLKEYIEKTENHRENDLIPSIEKSIMETFGGLTRIPINEERFLFEYEGKNYQVEEVFEQKVLKNSSVYDMYLASENTDGDYTFQVVLKNDDNGEIYVLPKLSQIISDTIYGKNSFDANTMLDSKFFKGFQSIKITEKVDTNMDKLEELKENANQENEVSTKLMQGVCDILNGDNSNYMQYLDTMSKMVSKYYSPKNAMYIFEQYLEKCFKRDKIDINKLSQEEINEKVAAYLKEDNIPTLCMGYEKWKEYGRQVTGKDVAYSIFVPIKAYENQKDGLYQKIVSELSYKDEYHLGNSRLYFRKKEDETISVLYDNKKVICEFKKQDYHKLKSWLTDKVINQTVVGYKTMYTYDIRDTIEPEFLYVNANQAKQSEIVLGKDNKPIEYKGKIKIYNTEERRNKLVFETDMKVEEMSDEDMDKLFAVLVEISKDRNVKSVDIRKIEGSKGGWFDRSSKEIVISSEKNPTERVITMLHEMSHATLHSNLEELNQNLKDDNNVEMEISRELLEVQAESMCYMAAKKLGIDTSTRSFKYIAGWNGKYDLAKLEMSMKLIMRESQRLVDDINAKMAELGIEFGKENVENKVTKVQGAIEYQNFVKEAKTTVLSDLSSAMNIKNEMLTEIKSMAESHSEKLNEQSIVSKEIKAEQYSNVLSQLHNLNMADKRINELNKVTDNIKGDALIRIIGANLRKNEVYKQQFEQLSQDLTTLAIENMDEVYAAFEENRKEFLRNYASENHMSITDAQLKYISESRYLFKTLGKDAIKYHNFKGYIEEGIKRYDKMFENLKGNVCVEINEMQRLHNWTAPIKDGDIMTAIDFNNFTEKLEKEVRKSIYRAGLACDVSVYLPNKQDMSVLHFKYDIGDGRYNDVSELVRTITNIEHKDANINKVLKKLQSAWDKDIVNKQCKTIDNWKIKPLSNKSVVQGYDFNEVKSIIQTKNFLKEDEMDKTKDMNTPSPINDERNRDKLLGEQEVE